LLGACDGFDYQHCQAALAAASTALLEAQSRAADEATRNRFADARIALVSYQGGQDARYSSDSVRAFEARSVAMAAVFQLLRKRYFPAKKALLWAHNIHVVKQHESVLGSWTGGAIITQGTLLDRELIPGAYRAAAMVGRTVAVNRPEQRGAVSPSPGMNSLEVMLHELGTSVSFLDLQQGHARAVLPESQPVELGAPGVELLVPERCFDGIFFLDESPMAEPL
jgi:erythromycin esterase-like protein